MENNNKLKIIRNIISWIILVLGLLLYKLSYGQEELGINFYRFLRIIIIIILIPTFIYSISITKYNLKTLKTKYNLGKSFIWKIRLLLLFIVICFVNDYFGVYGILKNKIEVYKENIIIEGIKALNNKDHDVVTFDNIVTIWGNDITKDRYYKIDNVKLNESTDTLYIEYTYNKNKKTSNIVIRHGIDEIYEVKNTKSFVLSYLYLYNDLILYGTDNCDKVSKGICTIDNNYDSLLGFNHYYYLDFYDNTANYEKDGISNNMELDIKYESIYSKPYNKFKVYNIKYENDEFYVYTIVDDYKSIYEKDKEEYIECDNELWETSSYDMQRLYKFKLVYNAEYEFYYLNQSLVSSIKYKDYCNNENIFNK